MDFFLIGVGGHSKVIVEMLRLLKHEILGLYDDNPLTHSKVFYELKVFGPISSITNGSMLEYYKKKYTHDQIKFIDPIPKDRVKSFLEQVDVCFDSIDSRIARFGLSRNKWIDYMNSGKPIICVTKGYQSMINEANCGSFIEPNNVKLLISEILKYKQMPKQELKEIGARGNHFIIKNRQFSILAKDFEYYF